MHKLFTINCEQLFIIILPRGYYRLDKGNLTFSVNWAPIATNFDTPLLIGDYPP